MPIVDSRLQTGTLTLDAIPFASQATNVTLEPSTDTDGDELEVLSGETITADDVTTWELSITAVQDFDDPEGFIAFSLTNAGELVPYSWKPNADGPTFTGTVRVRPVTIGGDVKVRNTTEATWPLTGQPVVSWPTP